MAKSIDTLGAKVHNVLKKTGDAMISGFLTLFQDPVEDMHAVTKRYVDGLFAQVGDPAAFLGTVTQNGLSLTTSTLGLASPSVGGVASLVDDATGAYLNYASTTTSGWTFSTGSTERQFLPDTTWVIKTGTDISSVRLWVCLAGAGISAIDVAGGGTNIMGFNFSTSEGHTTWHCRTDSNGVGGTDTDSSITVTADTRYVLRVDASTAGTVRFYINGALVQTHTTTLPPDASQLSTISTCFSISGASRSIRLRRLQQTSF